MFNGETALHLVKKKRKSNPIKNINFNINSFRPPPRAFWALVKHSWIWEPTHRQKIFTADCPLMWLEKISARRNVIILRNSLMRWIRKCTLVAANFCTMDDILQSEWWRKVQWNEESNEVKKQKSDESNKKDIYYTVVVYKKDSLVKCGKMIFSQSF